MRKIQAPLLFIIKSFLTSFVIPVAVLVLDHDCVVVCGIVHLAVQTLLALSRAGWPETTWNAQEQLSK